MKTYQDLVAVGDSADLRFDFIWQAINEYKSSDQYFTAVTAREYDEHRNVTITKFQRMLYTITGEQVPDRWGANYKLASNFFHRFVTQQTQFLLGNGCMWNEQSTGDKLGDDFDARLKEAGHSALVGGVAYGFFDLDRLRVFNAWEFVPIYDEENGALMAGIRWWQVDQNKPKRATLYEVDGYTEVMQKDGENVILQDKKPYKITAKGDLIDRENDTVFYKGENYPSFPIVPLWGNDAHQSELVGMQEQIDCYDLIKSGFANNVDEASYIYWALKNAGGMDDDVSLVKFVERMKTMHAANIDGDGASAEAHTVETPVESRERLLDRLSADMYKDFMAFDTEQIASGAVTATQIKAGYEPLNSKVDEFEYQIKIFLQDILAVAGVDDEPTFTRSKVVNVQEEIGTVLAAAQYLPQEYVTKKILTLLGDGDKTDEILNQMEDEDESRFVNGYAGGAEPEEAEAAGRENQEEI